MSLPELITKQLKPFIEKYSSPIFSLKWQVPDTLTGFVLTTKQYQWLEKHLPQIKLAIEILEEKPGKDWVVGKDKTPLSLYQNNQQEKLNTQWEANEPPLKRFLSLEEMSLVQKHEKTIGWVKESEISSIYANSLNNSSKPVSSPNRENFIQELYSHLEIPYVLGGRSNQGIDCSGLVQRALWNACRCDIPRHSLDQMQHSLRIPQGKEEPGDLIFARQHFPKKISRILHVGILVEKDTILHACRAGKKVLLMRKAQFFSSYVYAGSRTIPNFLKEVKKSESSYLTIQN